MKPLILSMIAAVSLLAAQNTSTPAQPAAPAKPAAPAAAAPGSKPVDPKKPVKRHGKKPGSAATTPATNTPAKPGTTDNKPAPVSKPSVPATK